MPKKLIKIMTTIVFALIGLVIVILGIQQSDFSNIKKYDKNDKTPREQMMSPLKKSTANARRHNRNVAITGNNMATLGDFNFNVAGGKTLIANISLKYKSTQKERGWFESGDTIEKEIIQKSIFLRDAAINTMIGNDRATIDSKRLRKDLKKNLNETLRCGEIEEVYFNKFILQ